MRLGLFVLLLTGIPAMAGQVLDPTVGFFDGFSTPGVTNNYAGPVNSALMSGTACFGGFCPGQAVPGPGPLYTVSDPITMSITSFQLTCAELTGCLAYVQADFSFEATAAAQYAVSLGIDGSANGGLSFSYGASMLNYGSGASLVGNQTVSLPFTNSSSFPPPLAAINDSFSLGVTDVGAGDQIRVSIHLLVPSMRSSGSFQLPDSLTLTLADTSAVPEPATVSLLGLGLAALVLGRKRV